MDDERTLAGCPTSRRRPRPLALRQLRALYDDLDPCPTTSSSAISFSLALDEMFEEVARMTRCPWRSWPSAGSQPATRTETLTFSAERLTAMVTVSPTRPGPPPHRRLARAQPSPCRVRLRMQGAACARRSPTPTAASASRGCRGLRPAQLPPASRGAGTTTATVQHGRDPAVPAVDSAGGRSRPRWTPTPCGRGRVGPHGHPAGSPSRRRARLRCGTGSPRPAGTTGDLLAPRARMSVTLAAAEHELSGDLEAALAARRGRGAGRTLRRPRRWSPPSAVSGASCCCARPVAQALAALDAAVEVIDDADDADQMSILLNRGASHLDFGSLDVAPRPTSRMRGGRHRTRATATTR